METGKTNLTRYLLLALSVSLSACSKSDPPAMMMSGNEDMELPPVQGEGDTAPPAQPVSNFAFSVSSEIATQESQFYSDLVNQEIGGAVASLNRAPNFFNNIQVPVAYRTCGFANAFYLSTDKSITLCHELALAAFTQFRANDEDDAAETIDLARRQTLSMMVFVLYHEVGHAMDDILDLNVGGSVESVADAIGVVLSIQTQRPLAPLNAGLYFLNNDQGSFADEHDSGIDRSGRILCWTIGSSTEIADQLPLTTANFVNAGRDCPGEYADQVQFVSSFLPNLTSISAKSTTDTEASIADERQFADIDLGATKEPDKQRGQN